MSYTLQDREPKLCRICGAEFTPKHYRTTVCSDPVCRRKQERERAERRKAIVQEQRPIKVKVCAICGQEFPLRYYRSTACSDPECQRQNLNRLNRERREQQKTFRAMKGEKIQYYKCPCCGKRRSKRKHSYCKHCIEVNNDAYAETVVGGFDGQSIDSFSVHPPSVYMIYPRE